WLSLINFWNLKVCTKALGQISTFKFAMVAWHEHSNVKDELNFIELLNKPTNRSPTTWRRGTRTRISHNHQNPNPIRNPDLICEIDRQFALTRHIVRTMVTWRPSIWRGRRAIIGSFGSDSLRGWGTGEFEKLDGSFIWRGISGRFCLVLLGIVENCLEWDPLDLRQIHLLKLGPQVLLIGRWPIRNVDPAEAYALKVAAGQIASTGMVALSYVQKVSEKVNWFLVHFILCCQGMSRDVTASFGYDYILRQCRLRGKIDSNGVVAAFLESLLIWAYTLSFRLRLITRRRITSLDLD
ncbi:Probable mitochondrial import receptor subunit TOM40-2, partial [Striga hermonthica]